MVSCDFIINKMETQYDRELKANIVYFTYLNISRYLNRNAISICIYSQTYIFYTEFDLFE